MRAWVWDWIDGEWQIATRSSLLPGRIVCVAASCGGYRTDRGFDASSTSPVPVVQMEMIPDALHDANTSDNQQDDEGLSFNRWKSIAFHSTEVVNAVCEITANLKLDETKSRILALAAQWHDIGKSHPAFQNMLLVGRDNATALRDRLWAKSDGKSQTRTRYYSGDERQDERVGFRHELASALALFAILELYQPTHAALLGEWSDALAMWGKLPTCELPTKSDMQDAYPTIIQPILDCSASEFNLLAYLVASHHGKVRLALHASPKDQDYEDFDGRGLPIRGVREGDRLPAIALSDQSQPFTDLTLTLEPAAMGLSHRTGASWRERCIALVACHSPTALAYLEAILRAADVRASQSLVLDPSLIPEVVV